MTMTTLKARSAALPPAIKQPAVPQRTPVVQQQPTSRVKEGAAPSVGKTSFVAANADPSAAGCSAQEKTPLGARAAAGGAVKPFGLMLNRQAALDALPSKGASALVRPADIKDLTPAWTKGHMPTADLKLLDGQLAATLSYVEQALQKPSVSSDEAAKINATLNRLSQAFFWATHTRNLPEPREAKTESQTPFGQVMPGPFGYPASKTTAYGWEEKAALQRAHGELLGGLKALTAAVDVSLKQDGPLSAEQTTVDLGEKERVVGMREKRSLLFFKKQEPVTVMERASVEVPSATVVETHAAMVRQSAADFMALAAKVNTSGLTETSREY